MISPKNSKLISDNNKVFFLVNKELKENKPLILKAKAIIVWTKITAVKRKAIICLMKVNPKK
jgi:hypothetical protein